MKIVLFNGPPSCGKDTAASIIQHSARIAELGYTPVWEKMSFPNKRAFAGTIGTAITSRGDIEWYEENKEKHLPTFGASYRQWQIDFSEKFMKPLYGKDIFAKLLIERLKHLSFARPLILVSDCGFQVEYDTIVEAFPPEDVMLVRITRDRCTFNNDSREYVQGNDNTWVIHNKFMSDFAQEVTDAVVHFLTVGN